MFEVNPALGCPEAGDQVGQGFAEEGASGKGENVGILKEIVEEGLDGLERIRSAQVEEDDAGFFGILIHFVRR